MPTDSESPPPSDRSDRCLATLGSHAGREFDALYARLAPILIAWANLRIHPRLRAHLDPEDLTQEVWWRALDGLSSFDSTKGSFRSWIFGIATRTLLNHFRSLRVRGEIASAPDSGPARVVLPSSIAEHATSISQRAARSEEAQKILQHVSSLDDEDKLLFAHCAIEGRGASVAAQLMGIPATAAAKRWQRLRRRLRDSTEAGELSADVLEPGLSRNDQNPQNQ